MLTDYLMVLLIRDALEVYVAFNFSCAAVCLAATPACWLMAFPCNKEYHSFSFLYLDICGVFMIQELRCESFVLENVIEVTKWIHSHSSARKKTCSENKPAAQEGPCDVFWL